MQLLYQFLMTQLRRIFIITLSVVNRFEKHILHSTNLEHCFTVSMTAHSIGILSELKMSSFGPYPGAKTRSPLKCAVNSTLLKGIPNVQQFLNVVN